MGADAGPKYSGQPPRSLVHESEQSLAYWPVECFLSLAWPSLVGRSGLALPLESPGTDPYARWCGRGQRATAAPMPINRHRDHFGIAITMSRNPHVAPAELKILCIMHPSEKARHWRDHASSGGVIGKPLAPYGKPSSSFALLDRSGGEA
jgi:hypothetical protein